MNRPEYVRDVGYPRSFVHQSSPAMLRLVAAISGVAPPVSDDFAYCDLGCGTGDTLLTFAAANAGAHFYGVDFNRDQIETARARAARAELANCTFVESDFDALLDGDLPALDFIVAHGIWTWVSAAKRDAILAFARAKLKPGGLFYVSYNALPGWAALEPLRRLMLEHTRDLGGSSLDRARAGYLHVRRLAEAGAAYFGSHPTARSMLALMEKAGLPYVAHEYFHAHWEPMYFADVARSLARAGLSYVGQVPLHLNLHQLALPPKIKELATGLSDRVDFETLKDFALNEPFRIDVYRRGAVSRTDETRRAYFEDTSFSVIAPAALVKREVALPVYTLDYTGPIYDAILRSMAEGAMTGRALSTAAGLEGAPLARIADALQDLTLGGQVMPLRARVGAHPPPRADDQVSLSLAFNRIELEAALAEARSATVAAPAAGIGVTLGTLECACLYVWTCVPADKKKSWIRTFVRGASVALKAAGRTPADNEERTRAFARELERFREQWGSLLLSLDVLRPTV